ncbi:ankyrin repeat domain-containing protein, partial [Vibrio parahaemolyticus]|uniref:ankyrin repeat domain-containing protein n=1 Tax=Vibrio parahaemolyticus TaxID=670 RepID=UPI00146ECA8E
LLEAGANINVRTTSFYGETVLHRAARDGCETCVNLLIEKNIDINQADSVGRTALFFALFQEKTATKLLEAGADPNISAESGTTPLIVATNHKNVPIIKLLLRHGASPEKT